MTAYNQYAYYQDNTYVMSLTQCWNIVGPTCSGERLVLAGIIIHNGKLKPRGDIMSRIRRQQRYCKKNLNKRPKITFKPSNITNLWMHNA